MCDPITKIGQSRLTALELELLLTTARILRAHVNDPRNQYRRDEVAALDEALSPWSAEPYDPRNEASDRPKDGD